MTRAKPVIAAQKQKKSPPRRNGNGLRQKDTGEDGIGAGADTSNGDEGAEDAESAHLDPEQLKTLTNAKLAELAKEMGIDTAKLKTKAQLIAAITDVPLEDAISEDDDGVDDGEAPPVLTPEAPVV